MDTNNPKQTPTQIANNVYQNLGSRFGVNQSPTHSHNDIDTPRLALDSINSSETLSAQPNHVLNVNTVLNMTGPITVLPIPIVTSVPSGIAPEGTLLLCMGGTIGLYAMVGGNWVFIGPTH